MHGRKVEERIGICGGGGRLELLPCELKIDRHTVAGIVHHTWVRASAYVLVQHSFFGFAL